MSKALLTTDERQDWLHVRRAWQQDLARTDGFKRVMPRLTPVRKRLLDFIRAYVRENEMAPNYSEMRAALGGYSKTGIHRLLRCLDAEKVIRVTPGKVRGIDVLLWS